MQDCHWPVWLMLYRQECHWPVTLDVVHAGLQKPEEYRCTAEAQLPDGCEEDGERKWFHRLIAEDPTQTEIPAIRTLFCSAAAKIQFTSCRILVFVYLAHFLASSSIVFSSMLSCLNMRMSCTIRLTTHTHRVRYEWWVITVPNVVHIIIRVLSYAKCNTYIILCDILRLFNDRVLM